VDTTNVQRANLIRQLGEEIRAGQRATDEVDEAVTALLKIDRQTAGVALLVLTAEPL